MIETEFEWMRCAWFDCDGLIVNDELVCADHAAQIDWSEQRVALAYEEREAVEGS